MDTTNFLLSILASIIATAISTYWLALISFRKYKKVRVGKPVRYVSILGQIIAKASEKNVKEAPGAAKAIVAARNDLAGSLSALAKHLNSDIDHLNQCIVNHEQRPGGIEELKAVYAAIQTLKEKWPLKEEQMGIESDKLIVELGFQSEHSEEYRISKWHNRH